MLSNCDVTENRKRKALKKIVNLYGVKKVIKQI